MPDLTVAQHTPEGVEVAGHHRSAGGHRFDQHNAETLTAGVGRTVDVGAAHRRSFSGVVHLTQKAQVRRQTARLAAQLVGVAVADDQ
ncbi:Uncharacterised protein [Mycobacterium tuberculosis]|uniref:Uncharacterized protein n=1 Tax=Mycobacterium tuberculosis TaxID=1773 RepID=A0A655A7S9_MYCTX|nr:Uncharacterised protein [Mycobacterium tuberculosis]CKR95287.1 Uncharacterised protein [Mycobacterium tuberculosis]CKS34794.1 Uncharacterised protein [Mycobacterium tuberculosis]CNV79818.1 Uncharacterised protein [Mycobacterium tuberculosis]COW07342.1 Uncharacterised protein [Mycobacterium tuberculosis]